MKFDVSKLDHKNHSFVEVIKYNDDSRGYYLFTCEKCKLVIYQWCNMNFPIWTSLIDTIERHYSDKRYEHYQMDKLEKELLSCEEVIIKNIIE